MNLDITSNKNYVKWTYSGIHPPLYLDDDTAKSLIQHLRQLPKSLRGRSGAPAPYTVHTIFNGHRHELRILPEQDQTSVQFQFWKARSCKLITWLLPSQLETVYKAFSRGWMIGVSGAGFTLIPRSEPKVGSDSATSKQQAGTGRPAKAVIGSTRGGTWVDESENER